MKPIEATLAVTITHASGPAITDPEHVLAWTCADGGWFEGGRNLFSFFVCSVHPNPDDCVDTPRRQACPPSNFATYRVSVHAARLDS